MFRQYRRTLIKHFWHQKRHGSEQVTNQKTFCAIPLRTAGIRFKKEWWQHDVGEDPTIGRKAYGKLEETQITQGKFRDITFGASQRQSYWPLDLKRTGRQSSPITWSIEDIKVPWASRISNHQEITWTCRLNWKAPNLTLKEMAVPLTLKFIIYSEQREKARRRTRWWVKKELWCWGSLEGNQRIEQPHSNLSWIGSQKKRKLQKNYRRST